MKNLLSSLTLLLWTFDCSVRSVRVSSDCGHPGLPPGAKLHNVDRDQMRFSDGQQVMYVCDGHFQTHIQTRRCMSGHWIGPVARCGKPMENDIIKIQINDCSKIIERINDTNNLNKTSDESVNEYPEIFTLKLNQSKNALNVSNSFHAHRSKSGPINVNGSDCYEWILTLQRPAIIPFMTIDFGTKISDDDIYYMNSKYGKVINVEADVNPNRKCQLSKFDNQINIDNSTNETYVLTVHHFRCDSINDNLYTNQLKQLSNTIVIKTHTNNSRELYLVAVFLSEHYTNPMTGKVNCGKPETRQTGVEIAESNSGSNQIQIKCNQTFDDITSGIWSLKQVHKQVYYLNCGVNGLWVGHYPKCVPRIRCPSHEQLEMTKDSSVIIESYENVYYVNETQWFSGEWSRVYYACANPEHVALGKQERKCIFNGTWTNREPKCTDVLKPEVLRSLTISPWTIIIILSTILMIFLIIVIIVVKKYVSKVRRDLEHHPIRVKPRNDASEIYADFRSSYEYEYDDTALPNNYHSLNNYQTAYYKSNIDKRVNQFNHDECVNRPMREAEYTQMLPP